MTKQEMFDKAWRGLSSQNWERCVNEYGKCVYSDGTGKHCAWGWVDPEADGHVDVYRVGGIAQWAHDTEDSPTKSMKQRFVELADAYHLEVPNDEV
jgi:hypothetical protein